MDVAVVAVTAMGTVRSDADFVFYNAPIGLSGAVGHLGHGERDGRCHDRVRLHLDRLPGEITALHITLSAESAIVGHIRDLTLTLHGAEQDTLAHLDLTGAGPEPALVAAEVYRRSGGWKVRCVGQGWDEGLAALARHFGISVEDDTPDAEPGSPGATAPPPSARMAAPSLAPPPTPSPTSRSAPGPASRLPPVHTPSPAPMPLMPPPGSTSVPKAPAPPPGGATVPMPLLPTPPAPVLAPPPAPAPGPASASAEPVGALQAVRSRWLGRRAGADAARLAQENQQLRTALEAATGENAALRAELQRVGATNAATLAQEMAAQRMRAAQEQAHLQQQMRTAQQELELITRDIASAEFDLAELRENLVATDEEAVLQEVGVYRYAHPLDDAVAYKARLTDLKDQIKVMIRGGSAVLATTSWQVNGSTRDGAKMVKETSKLMLRAFNAEADNCVRVVRPHTVHTAAHRLEKAAATIARLGSMMSIQVSPAFLQLRLEEIHLTADYLAKVEEERERQREARERAREEAKAAAEFEREKARLLKEQSHYTGALAKARAGGASSATLAELEAKLLDVQGAISSVDAREANLRAGWVYVISNIGAFGEHMVKIGMTRRLDPMDRVRELGDASVPFRFDVHALIFSDDAVSLENDLHSAFADSRVNRVNKHREFFYATPAQVREQLARIAGQHLLEYRDTAEALEWRASGEHTTTTTPRAT